MKKARIIPGFFQFSRLLINSLQAQAVRLVCNLGAALKVCAHPPKNGNNKVRTSLKAPLDEA